MESAQVPNEGQENVPVLVPSSALKNHADNLQSEWHRDHSSIRLDIGVWGHATSEEISNKTPAPGQVQQLKPVQPDQTL